MEKNLLVRFAVLSDAIFIFTAFNGYLKKGTAVNGFQTLAFCMSTTSCSTAQSVT